MQIVAVTWYAYKLTGSATSVGLLAALALGPTIVGSPIGGALADRFELRRLAIVLYICQGIPAAAMAILDLTGELPIGWLYALVFAGAIPFSLNSPVISLLGPYTVPEEYRRAALAQSSMMFNATVTVGTTALVAFTAMYATLSTTNRNLNETRRGARVVALVEEWSVTVADASSAIEILGQRANDLWAYGAAIEQQGVILDEALDSEATKETSYLKVRQSLAFSSAKAGLVSSEVTNKCLDKFVAMLDTWQNALNWTRSSLQVEGSVESGIAAVAMQQDNRTALSDSLTIVRNLARTELDTAGTDGSSVKCSIPAEDVLWGKLIPSEATE